MTKSLSREALLAQFCKPLEGHASMSDGQVAAQLQALAEWHLVHGAIERTFQFTNYWDTLAFINAIAFVIHREDHHPEIALSYNRAVLRFNTHSVSGISVNDFICAAKCDALYIARPTPAA